MNKVVKFFIERPIWTNAIIVMVLLVGIFSYNSMNKSFFPEQDPARVIISVAYPGASPQEMEEGITIKVEQALKGIEDIEHIESKSSENFASITVEAFPDANMTELTAEVENAVNSINSYPAGAEKPTVTRIKAGGMSSIVAWVGVMCEDCDLEELKLKADQVENELLATGVISQIEKQGFPEIEIDVYVKEDKLKEYNILFDEISNAIKQKNMDMTLGEIKSDVEEMIIRSYSKTTRVDEIGNIILRTSPSGGLIRVKDVAEVKERIAESTFSTSYYEGMRSIVFSIKKTPEEDITAIANAVKKYKKEFNATEDGYQFNVLFEFNSMLEDRIDLLTSNGIMGLVLVLIMLGLFLSTRLSFWVAFGIPFSFLGMFAIAYWFGATINMISLFGMILVVGILVDDGIVIAENIFSHFERGKSPTRAAYDGTMEVLPSVFTSVVTTMVAFSIMFFVEGMEMMQEMAIVVVACLGLSLIEAFFILPAHLSSEKILSQPEKGTFRYKFRSFFEGILKYLRDDIYGVAIVPFIKYYKLAVFIPLTFIFVTLGLMMSGKIASTFFPDMKGEMYTVEIAYQPGESSEQTKAFLDSVRVILQEADQYIIDNYGDSIVKYSSLELGFAEKLGEVGNHSGLLRIFLDFEDSSTPPDTLFKLMNQRIENLSLRKIATGYYFGSGEGRFGKAVEYGMYSEDVEQLDQAREFFKTQLSQMNGVINVKDDQPLGKNEVNLVMKPAADMYGIGQAQILNQIRQGYFGSEAQRLIVGTDEVKIWVKYPEEERQTLTQLENMRIKTMNGEQIPLHELADFEVARGPVILRRRDGVRQVTIDADLIVPDSAGVVNKRINEELIPAVTNKFPNVKFATMGQSEESDKSTSSMIFLAWILFILMLIILTLNFSSLYQALLVLLSVPAGVFGGLFGHGLIGIPISIFSSFGLLALAGVLVNDSVVFLDQYNRNLREGMNVKDAVFDAAVARFRPILLTSVTTVAGLMPLILEKSFQAQFLIPTATSVAFGILFGTIFLQLFFPSAILFGTFCKRMIAWFWTGKKPSMEEVETAVRIQKKLEAKREGMAS